MSRKKIIIIGAILLVGLFAAYSFYQKVYNTNTLKKGFVYIKSNATFDDLVLDIKPFLKNQNTFSWVANKKKFTKPRAGKYLINEGMTNNDLVNMFRSARQVPVKLSFNNQHTLAHLAGRISQQIEADSTALITAFTDTAYLSEKGLTKEAMLGVFIPNSYQVKWDISATKFRNKMYGEHEKFWNTSRLKKAKKLNLKPQEVMALASIVHKETAKKSERPIVAGLYLNRLQDKWPLQADPTIIFAMKQKYGQDFEMRRVLFKNIEETKNSPYNTYKKQGLPPSLIAMPDISAIDAVLNAKNHDYFYMCASVTKIGYHEFAKTLSQHNRNRAKFIAKKNKQGIRQ